MDELLQNQVLVGKLVRTLAVVSLVVLARWIVLARLRGFDGLSNDMRRRWAAQIRLATLLLVLLGLMLIWGSELKAFAFSVVAIAAAIVIATKELIMCLSGTLLKASGKSFKIGDRIEIGAFRGDVVDQTLVTTTVLEVGPGANFHQHTGRVVVIPNSIMLTTPVINETFLDEYVLHVFAIPLGKGDNWRLVEAALIEAARAECSQYLADAQKRIENMAKRQGIEPMSVAPRVTLKVEENQKLLALLRVPAPARRKGRVEQAILRRYLTWRQEQGLDEKDDDDDRPPPAS